MNQTEHTIIDEISFNYFVNIDSKIQIFIFSKIKVFLELDLFIKIKRLSLDKDFIVERYLSKDELDFISLILVMNYSKNQVLKYKVILYI